MAIDTIASSLLALDVFRGLTAAQIGRIAATADRMIFPDGHVMARVGDVADGAIIVVHGSASIRDDGTTVQSGLVIETGSMIGETAMLTEHHYGATIVARGVVRAVKIGREPLLEQMRSDPALREHFVRRLTSRLSRVALELRLIDERLAGHGQAAPAAARA
jgi:CRP-like cAMP-binding protein